MFAVMRAKGHQYRVEPGQVLTIDRMDGNAGDSVVFDEVLMKNDGSTLTVGKPTVQGVQVRGLIVEQKKMPKIIVFKYKRRKNHKKKRGHRQPMTVVRIVSIEG
jgi:large subunit ribosomal protein L21